MRRSTFMTRNSTRVSARLLWISFVLLLADELFVHGPLAGHAPTLNLPALAIVHADDPAVHSPWTLQTEEDEDTRETSIAAINESRPEVDLVIRKSAKTFELYVTTGEALVPAGGPDSKRAQVRYTIDSKPNPPETWVLSDDSAALLFPGDPRGLILSIRRAKRFAIEYSTKRHGSQSASFDVSMFPKELADALDAPPKKR